ncbi:MAG: shikimate dehydrogenase [Deltaproteobacteria bacterium]|nr:shikimate dehydrogenase [Deltaproteobacteria bacterium]
MSEISGRTTLLGLIADPIAQARSPGLANARLAALGRFGDVVLLPLHIGPDGLAALLAGLRRMRNFGGAIVSMPFKMAIVEQLDELTAEAQLVGAVNVIRRAADGRLVGTMLDGEGFVAGLGAAGHRVAGTSCVLAGAGGAASAVALALARHGCAALCILNRTEARAAALAARVAAAFPRVALSTRLAPHARVDIAVNGTSLGMQPDDVLPFRPEIVARAALVAECVIAPEITPLLALARRQGIAIHTGVPMLTAQIDLMLRFMGVG